MSYGGDDRGPTINILNWTFFPVTCLTVGMRLFSRISVGTFGRDDVIILVCVAILLAHNCAMTIAVEGGYGKHFQDLDPAQRPIAGHRAVITSAVAIQTFGLPKIAIICLLERLLELRLPVRIVLWGLSIILIISSLVLSIIWFVQCSPQAHQWDPINVPGTCWSPNVVLYLSYFVGVYSGVLDVILAVYPPFIIRKLHMSTGKKVFISACLGGGLVAAVTVFYKVTTIEGLSAAAKEDPTWAPVPLLIWTSIEANILIITASLPTIGPCVRVFAKRVKEYSSNSGIKGSKNKTYTYGYQSDRYQNCRSFTNRSQNQPPSEQDVPLVNFDPEANVNAFPQTPTRARSAGHGHGILKETEVEITHGSSGPRF